MRNKVLILCLIGAKFNIFASNPDKFACYMEYMGNQMIVQMSTSASFGDWCNSSPAFSTAWPTMHAAANKACGTTLPQTAVFTYLQFLHSGKVDPSIVGSTMPSINSTLTSLQAVNNWPGSYKIRNIVANSHTCYGYDFQTEDGTQCVFSNMNPSSAEYAVSLVLMYNYATELYGQLVGSATFASVMYYMFLGLYQGSDYVGSCSLNPFMATPLLLIATSLPIWMAV